MQTSASQPRAESPGGDTGASQQRSSKVALSASPWSTAATLLCQEPRARTSGKAAVATVAVFGPRTVGSISCVTVGLEGHADTKQTKRARKDITGFTELKTMQELKTLQRLVKTVF